MAMLRIMESARGDLRVEGRLTGAWVEALRRSCEEYVASGRPLTLDISDLAFVDRGGVDLLRALRTRGARLVNGSHFIVELLKEARP
jgi:anti-anti-sigma regulatory factor